MLTDPDPRGVSTHGVSGLLILASCDWSEMLLPCLPRFKPVLLPIPGRGGRLAKCPRFRPFISPCRAWPHRFLMPCNEGAGHCCVRLRGRVARPPSCVGWAGRWQ